MQKAIPQILLRFLVLIGITGSGQVLAQISPIVFYDPWGLGTGGYFEQSGPGTWTQHKKQFFYGASKDYFEEIGRTDSTVALFNKRSVGCQYFVLDFGRMLFHKNCPDSNRDFGEKLLPADNNNMSTLYGDSVSGYASENAQFIVIGDRTGLAELKAMPGSPTGLSLPDPDPTKYDENVASWTLESVSPPLPNRKLFRIRNKATNGLLHLNTDGATVQLGNADPAATHTWWEFEVIPYTDISFIARDSVHIRNFANSNGALLTKVHSDNNKFVLKSPGTMDNIDRDNSTFVVFPDGKLISTDYNGPGNMPHFYPDKIAALSVTNSAPGYALPPSNAGFCARENEQCTFSGSGVVYYGYGSNWTHQTLMNGTPCNNGVFGDPQPGVAKSCLLVMRQPDHPTTDVGSTQAGCYLAVETAARNSKMPDVGSELWFAIRPVSSNTLAFYQIRLNQIDLNQTRPDLSGPVLIVGDQKMYEFQYGREWRSGQDVMVITGNESPWAMIGGVPYMLHKMPFGDVVRKKQLTWTNCGPGCRAPVTYEQPTLTMKNCRDALRQISRAR